MATEEQNQEEAKTQSLVGALNNLARTVEERSDQLRRFNYFVLVVLVFLFVLATWNRNTLTNTNDILTTVESITNPNGELYRQSQLRTRAILQDNAIENDCRNRRRNAGLTAPEVGTPSAPKSCVSQTPPEIYPGPTTTVSGGSNVGS